MRLSDLHTGERAVIVKVYGHGSFRKRIIEMGFVKGNRVKVVMNAPLKDPIEYEVIGYKISLRREEANMIEVISESEAKASLQHNFIPQAVVVDETADISKKDEVILSEMEHLALEKRKEIKVALVGNPNCGKTSLFNMVSGAHEHVGNYSGVTVDAKEGDFEYEGYNFRLIDLPGTYSLSAYSPEELYVRKYLVEEMPDVVLNVLDATNLQRNLYLTTQLIDMNLRVVMALNMYDELEAHGDKIDVPQLSKLLGMPVIPTVSRNGRGLNELLRTIINVYENTDPKIARHIHIPHGSELEQSIGRVQQTIKRNREIRFRYSTRYLAIKYLEGDREVEEIIEKLENRDEIISARFEERNRIEKMLKTKFDDAIVEAKYGFIGGALAETFTHGTKKKLSSVSEKIDAVVTNRWAAFPIFFLFLYLIFTGTFVLGEYPMQWIESGVQWVSDIVGRLMHDGWVKDLLIDGVIGGVGSVLVFLPQILLLYLFISLLEDSGYMARAAFIMDRVMHKMGLHGKSFIPMIMGFGCNVPAIMATRSIESRKSRLITIMIIPFMSCAGRMPVYVLIAGAFFPKSAPLVLLGLYALGIIIAVAAARIMSYFIKDDDLPFVMELPPYRVPTSKSIFRHTWEKGKQYLQKMSGTILICSVVIWFLGYFPNHNAYATRQEQQEHSFIGYIGKGIEPVLKPLGFDWRMGVGIVAGVGAKELVVSTLGVMYSGDSEDGTAECLPPVDALDTGSPDCVYADIAEQSIGTGLQDNEAVIQSGSAVSAQSRDKAETEVQDTEGKEMTRLQRELVKSVTPAAALAFMVFILLYFPCIATFTAIARETGSWKWAGATAVYTIAIAWLFAYLTRLLFGLIL
ncbi:MAG: ferrous iron transport protein B [Candidatus Cryptobacteroides sp.]